MSTNYYDLLCKISEYGLNIQVIPMNVDGMRYIQILICKGETMLSKKNFYLYDVDPNIPMLNPFPFLIKEINELMQRKEK